MAIKAIFGMLQGFPGSARRIDLLRVNFIHSECAFMYVNDYGEKNGIFFLQKQTSLLQDILSRWEAWTK